MLPTIHNLPQLGAQWQRRLEKLPPEERGASAARLREEAEFFVRAFRQPAAQRETIIRERLETLMNDPAIQSEWFDERINMLVDLSPEDRSKLLRDYVREKKKILETP